MASPLPKNLGRILSLANACMVRGAARILPSAEDRVAAHRPAYIRGGQRDISFMTVRLLANSAWGTFMASQQTWAR